MDFIYVGKIVNTHGLKGEIRILSDFKYKDIVFKKDNKIYINDVLYSILSYRHHKNFEMITISNINSIEKALTIKGLNVYINRLDYKFDGYLDEDLIGLSAYDNDLFKGKIIGIEKSSKYDLLVIDGVKRHLVPNIKEFIKKVDLKNNRIDINYIKGLDNED